MLTFLLVVEKTLLHEKTLFAWQQLDIITRNKNEILLSPSWPEMWNNNYGV